MTLYIAPQLAGRDIVAITFDQAMDTSVVPDPGSFTVQVTVGGVDSFLDLLSTEWHDSFTLWIWCDSASDYDSATIAYAPSDPTLFRTEDGMPVCAFETVNLPISD